MCYHTSLVVDRPALEARFDAALDASVPLQPVYHANAYQFPQWPIQTRQEPGKLQWLRWGLIPRWVKSPADADEIRTRTLNARSESLYEKPSFRTAIQKEQRCLIPVTGFYEWHTMGKKKFPFYITIDQPIFSIAGIWDEWPDPDTGELIRTYSLLTTEANPLLAAIHNDKKRMPMVLSGTPDHPGTEHAWLHENLTEQQVLELAKTPYSADRMHSYAVSKLITSRTEPSDVPAVMAPANYPELAEKPALFA